jgi:hypothetical protein
VAGLSVFNVMKTVFTSIWNIIKTYSPLFVNFFTGGDGSLAKDAPAKVNDMILTPEGRFETNPNDYIMATRDPASLARSGQERGISEKESIAELVKAVVSSIRIAAGMIVNAIR